MSTLVPRFTISDGFHTLPWLARLGITSIILIQVATIYLVGSHPAENWIHALYDDAYYYLGVAWHIGQGLGSTFHPPFETNGYQPLWLGLLSLVAWLAGDDKIVLVQATLALNLVILVLSYFLASRSQHISPFALIISILCFPFVFCFGMETVLLLPLFILLSQTGGDEWLKRGILFALLFYARLDALAICAVWQLWELITPQWRTRLPNVVRSSLLTLALILPYFLLNHLYFGVPLPISGLSKALGNLRGENIAVFVWYIGLATLPASLSVTNYLLRKQSGLATHRGELLAIRLLCVQLICALYYCLLSGWPAWDWYAWPAALSMLCGLTSTIYYLHSASMQRHRLLGVISICLSLSLVGLIGIKSLGGAHHLGYSTKALFKPGFSEDWYGRQNLMLIENFFAKQPASFIAMGDRAGSFGYFLPDQFKFLHTEGLVAPLSYFQAMKQGKAVDYLVQQGVKWLVVDREQYLQVSDQNQQTIYGVAEPIQGLSAKIGPYLICFPASAIHYQQAYQGQTRYVFAVDQRVSCPTELLREFETLKQTYGGLRHHGLPSETPTLWLNRWLGLAWG